MDVKELSTSMMSSVQSIKSTVIGVSKITVRGVPDPDNHYAHIPSRTHIHANAYTHGRLCMREHTK
jgi:hypothetical protein